MASMVNRPLASHFTIDVTWQSSPLIKYTENSVPRVLVYSFCMACIPHRPWGSLKPGPGVFFFGLSSDLEFFLNKIFFPIIKINRLPSITMEAQAVARDQHLARWKRVSIRFEFLALIMVVMLLVGSRVYFR